MANTAWARARRRAPLPFCNSNLTADVQHKLAGFCRPRGGSPHADMSSAALVEMIAGDAGRPNIGWRVRFGTLQSGLPPFARGIHETRHRQRGTRYSEPAVCGADKSHHEVVWIEFADLCLADRTSCHRSPPTFGHIEVRRRCKNCASDTTVYVELRPRILNGKFGDREIPFAAGRPLHFCSA
jgi:hypothetical protein